MPAESYLHLQIPGDNEQINWKDTPCSDLDTDNDSDKSSKSPDASSAHESQSPTGCTVDSFRDVDQSEANTAAARYIAGIDYCTVASNSSEPDVVQDGYNWAATETMSGNVNPLQPLHE